ncbi:MAG: hypothetical protein ABJF10_10540 [Chthoniobacter sp.]|uniref:hypothetical protein n=1 Tax=Chthoniobacter sp. TaxID=2510640 RepID=UPI0032AAB052
MAEDEHKAELVDALAHSRAHITGNALALGRDLDFVSRARRAFKTHPAVWIGGAVLLGLVISRLPLRRKAPAAAPRKGKNAEPTIEKVEKAGLLLGALKIAFDIARPTIMGWATRRVAEYFEAGNRGGTTRR